MRETTTLPQYSGLAILLIIHECFRDRPSLEQRKLQVSENIFVEPSLEATEKRKKKKIDPFFDRNSPKAKNYHALWSDKNFRRLCQHKFQGSRGSLGRLDLLLYEDDPFPTLFASSFSIYLTHPSTGIAYTRYKVSSQERELHSCIHIRLDSFHEFCLHLLHSN